MLSDDEHCDTPSESKNEVRGKEVTKKPVKKVKKAKPSKKDSSDKSDNEPPRKTMKKKQGKKVKTWKNAPTVKATTSKEDSSSDDLCIICGDFGKDEI